MATTPPPLLQEAFRIDRRPVAALAASPAGAVEAVVTDDGDRVPVERVIIAPRSRPRDEVLCGLGATVVDGWVQVQRSGTDERPGRSPLRWATTSTCTPTWRCGRRWLGDRRRRER
ncbi:MAG: hypothetical protein R2705_18425 [Ilumatobacteraceae bacterium]